MVSRALCLIEPAQMDLDAVPLLQRPFVHPVASLKRLYIWLVETLGHKSLPMRKIFFTTHLHTLLLILLHVLVGAESIVLFVPLAFYYLSFVVMILATFQILQRKRELSDLRIWSRLFLSYSGGSLNPEEAEYQYCRNNLKPYAHFFFCPFAESNVVSGNSYSMDATVRVCYNSFCPDSLDFGQFYLARKKFEISGFVGFVWF